MSSKSLLLPNMADVVGQEHVKRALEVGAVKLSNILMVGPPGSGKSMLSEVYASLMGNAEYVSNYLNISHGDTVKSLKALIEKTPDAVIVGDDFAELKRDVMFFIREVSVSHVV